MSKACGDSSANLQTLIVSWGASLCPLHHTNFCKILQPWGAISSLVFKLGNFTNLKALDLFSVKSSKKKREKVF